MADTATQQNVKVLIDGLTLHKQVGELQDPITGRVTGIQQGNGFVAYEGDVLAPGDISPVYFEALADPDHELHEGMTKRLAFVSDDPEQNALARLGEPFVGYDDMDEGDVLNAIALLPSATKMAIIEYEKRHQNRSRITTYNIGFGESPVDRQEGRVGSPHQDTADGKTVAQLTTREVPEEGIVTPGDGITGTGDPQIPHGSRTEQEEEAAPRARRRGRRARPKAADKADNESDSNDDTNEGDGDSKSE